MHDVSSIITVSGSGSSNLVFTSAPSAGTGVWATLTAADDLVDQLDFANIQILAAGTYMSLQFIAARIEDLINGGTYTYTASVTSANVRIWNGVQTWNGNVFIEAVATVGADGSLTVLSGGNVTQDTGATAAFAGGVTFTSASTVDIASNAHVNSGGSIIADSGAAISLAAGSTFLAFTAVSSESKEIAAAGHNFNVDCSAANTFVYSDIDPSEASYTWTLINAQPGAKGRIYFLSPGTLSGSPPFALTMSPGTVVNFGPSQSVTTSKWYYFDFHVVEVGTTPFLMWETVVQQN